MDKCKSYLFWWDFFFKFSSGWVVQSPNVCKPFRKKGWFTLYYHCSNLPCRKFWPKRHHLEKGFVVDGSIIDSSWSGHQALFSGQTSIIYDQTTFSVIIISERLFSSVRFSGWPDIYWSRLLFHHASTTAISFVPCFFWSLTICHSAKDSFLVFTRTPWGYVFLTRFAHISKLRR